MPVEKPIDNKISTEFEAFKKEFEPLQKEIPILTDACTGASYCECQIRAKKVVELSTIDVPLNPSDPTAPRANREITDSEAFEKMKADAKNGRTFSNIVAEYTKEFGDAPLKIIGGQHRYEAIREALEKGQNQFHGFKVYFALNTEQRLDVQLISNTNIGSSRDLIDRMLEDARGPELRKWCKAVGLLKPSENFTDRYRRGGAISVRLAKTFITNFYRGQTITEAKFEISDTTPEICKTGKQDPAWDAFVKGRPAIWTDQALAKAAEEFAALIKTQREAFKGKAKVPADFPEKTLNPAILSGWSYVAGLLQKNQPRLKKHFDLSRTSSHDPLNAAQIAKGRHISDGPKYRGFGNRQDPRECGRAVELFYKQTDAGQGITQSIVDIAITRGSVAKLVEK